MTDLPAGKWTELLVGHQWPDSTSLHAASHAAARRGAVQTAYLEYASILRSVRDTALAQQQGLTADNIQSAFDKGEQRSYYIAEKNSSIMYAYESAHASVSELRAQLSAIAEHGNTAIAAIEATAPSTQVKQGKVFEVVLASQAAATSAAATQSENVLSAIQSILQTSGITASARELAESSGVDLRSAFKPSDDNAVRSSIDRLLNSSPSRDTDVSNIPKSNDSLASATAAGNTTGNSIHSASPTRAVSTETTTGGGSLPSGIEVSRPTATGARLEIATNAGSIGAPAPTVNTTFGSGTAAPTSTTTLSVGSSPQGIRSTPSQHALSSGTSPQSSNPLTTLDRFLQPLTATLQPGTSTSPAAEALSNTALDTKQHTPLQVAPISAQAIPSTPVFEAAHATAPPPDVQPITHAPMVQPVATAAPPIQPSTIGATPTVAPSNLPGYGADVRPAVATPSHAPTPAMPTSAPTTSHNSGAHTPSGVVRQQPTEREPVALAEKAYAATSTGATAAATAQKAAATKRLKDLLAAVVQQEPKLRWAIGDHSNGTTVIATDIAFGWIPPHVEIPAGLTLIQPQSTARSLDALLTDTSGRETFEPGQPKPWADKPQMSTRARETKQPEDLSWSLIQATKWRDGLPRLAHTLAKAATAKTGYLDSEVELLHQHLNRTAQEALDEYPHTSPIAIGNWQLLACIAALIDNEITCANYHLAWFEYSHAKQNT